MHIFDASGPYRGRVCVFGQCPKAGKLECLVPNCGEKPFLRQLDNYHFNGDKFERAPKVMLFDRGEGFLVGPPRVEDAKPAIIIERRPREEGDEDDDEGPF